MKEKNNDKKDILFFFYYYFQPRTKKLNEKEKNVYLENPSRLTLSHIEWTGNMDFNDFKLSTIGICFTRN